MGSILIDQLPNSRLGLGGTRPPFMVTPNPPNSLHQTYSVDGNPSVNLIDINNFHTLPLPSRLDEWDSNNHNPYKSAPGRKYMDNPPG